jgi:hypothetical protein
MNDTGPAATSLATVDFAVGSILRRALQILRRNFLSFFSLSGVTLLPLALISWLLPDEPFVLGLQSLTKIVTRVMDVTFVFLCQGVVVYAALQDVRGRPVSAFESLAKALGWGLPLLILSVTSSVAILVGLVLLMIPGLIIRTILFASIPACVVEGRGPFESWSRSATLTKGYRWQIFGMTLLLAVISVIVNLILIYGVLGPDSGVSYFVLLYAWETVFTAYQGAVTAVAYHRLRVLKEGADSDHVTAVFD